jgi:protein-S-isoprenylcysteine O-methyltransferase Ste14
MQAAGRSRRNYLVLPQRVAGHLPFLQDALLVAISSVFIYVHGHRILVEHSFTSIPFVAENFVLVAIFLTRRRSVATSARPFEWVVASGGAWLPMLMWPIDGASSTSATIGMVFQMVGLTGSSFCTLYLGRSFGVVAANRGLKVAGPYAFVRHPIYASHVVTTTGFLIANFSPLNAVIWGTAVMCQFLRIRAEERVLTETADYRSYSEQVRWRLLPGVF